MNSITTRQKAKKLSNVKEELDKESLVNNYCRTIDNLKKRLEKQEMLNKTLLEEQESNVYEFENQCKQIQQLKKKAYEEEERGLELSKVNKQLMNDNSKLKEDLELWENQQLCVTITELGKDLNKKIEENTELQLRYSELLLQTTSCNKKGFKCFRKRNINVKILTRKYLRNNIKIKELTSLNELMNTQLIEREKNIRALQEEGDRFIEIIRKNEEDLQERQITYDKVIFLETQLYKLKNLIDKGENKTLPTTYSDKTAGEENNINKVSNKINTHLKISNGSIAKSLVIFSDAHGRNVTHPLINKLPVGYAVQNICKPFNHFRNIILDDMHKSSVNDVVILIGDYDTVKTDVNAYLQKLDDTAKNIDRMTKKLIVTTILYKTERENNTISKLNIKLFALAALNDNMSIIDLNAPRSNQSFSNFAASSIVALLLKKNNCKNLVLLTKGCDNYVKDNTSSENFQHAVTPEVVK